MMVAQTWNREKEGRDGEDKGVLLSHIGYVRAYVRGCACLCQEQRHQDKLVSVRHYRTNHHLRGQGRQQLDAKWMGGSEPSFPFCPRGISAVLSALVAREGGWVGLGCSRARDKRVRSTEAGGRGGQ